jgi:hypothetical protein
MKTYAIGGSTTKGRIVSVRHYARDGRAVTVVLRRRFPWRYHADMTVHSFDGSRAVGSYLPSVSTQRVKVKR